MLFRPVFQFSEQMSTAVRNTFWESSMDTLARRSHGSLASLNINMAIFAFKLWTNERVKQCHSG